MKSLARLSAVMILSGLAGGALVAGQQQPLPSEPPRQFGAGITGAYEGWFKNDDGSFSFLVGSASSSVT
jgi:hypothetical protein